MRWYCIRESLEKVEEQGGSAEKPYVAVLTKDEWSKFEHTFDMGIELEPDDDEIMQTKAEANYDSITGTFSIPNRKDFSAKDDSFAFAMDEKGIVFIDDSGVVSVMVKRIAATKKWKKPSLERFIYDFFVQIVANDQRLITAYEKELDKMEDDILNEAEGLSPDRVNEIRSDLRDLITHYEQLLDAVAVFEENENGFFSTENLRYFRLYINRIERLKDSANGVKDYAMQVRDVYKMHLDIKQNNIMTVLTVVTTIFMPLTLIVGWYGMNFKYMPELDYKMSYPILILISVSIVIGSIIYFKKKKWL